MIYIQLVNSIWVAEQKNDGQQMFLEMFPSALSEFTSPVEQWVTMAYKSSPWFDFLNFEPSCEIKSLPKYNLTNTQLLTKLSLSIV